jgi:protein-disulfide isomerase
MTSLPSRIWRDTRALASSPFAALVALVFLVGSGMSIRLFSHEPGASGAADEPMAPQSAAALSAENRAEFEKYWTSLPARTVPVPADGAAVVVVKFNDYQCPPCKQSYLLYKDILTRFEREKPGAVKFVTKDFPLDRECYADMQRDLHVAACEAAVAVRLADRAGRHQALEEWLFANQQSLTPDAVKRAAREVGGVTNFDAEYQRTLEAVKADIALGRLLGVNSTPTFFINGRKPDQWLPPQYFEAALEYELKQKGR